MRKKITLIAILFSMLMPSQSKAGSVFDDLQLKARLGYNLGVTRPMGLGAGVDWQFYQNMGVSFDVNWGLTNVFKSDFKIMKDSFYPIYSSIGFFYRLK